MNYLPIKCSKRTLELIDIALEGYAPWILEKEGITQVDLDKARAEFCNAKREALIEHGGDIEDNPGQNP